MGPQEKLFKKEYAKELFNIAISDLKTAEVLFVSSEIRRETILFHLEQAVEKSLKAWLCFHEKPIPFTHDLLAILQKFDSSHLPPGGYSLHDLTPFASIRRYEEGNYIITPEDIKNAIQITQLVIDWVHGYGLEKT